MASPLQQAAPADQRVGRNPQTTEPSAAGGPFLRHSREARYQGFNVAGQAFGTLINQPLKAVPGYLRYLDVEVIASGGTTTGAAAQADGTYNVFSQILFKDAFGQPVLQGGGFELLFLVAQYSGQHGFWNSSSPAALPNFSAVSATTGAFTFSSRLPLELFDGFCAIAGANASAVPSLSLTLNSAAGTLSGTLTTPPTMQVIVEEAFYQVPLDDPNMAPPDNGSSHQWSQVTLPGQISGTSQNVSLTLPPLGSYVTTLIFVFRDGAGARSDNILPAGSSGIELWVDGVPLFIESVDTRINLMFQMFGVTRPAGVIVYTFRDSVANFGPVSAVDTGDLFLPTTPGSQLELRSAGWGRSAFTNPASVTLVVGRVYAAGGIPYTHIGD
jgi:hypothetical protein